MGSRCASYMGRADVEGLGLGVAAEWTDRMALDPTWTSQGPVHLSSPGEEPEARPAPHDPSEDDEESGQPPHGL